MTEQTCGTCGRPGRAVPLTAGGQVVGESVVHEDDQGLLTHNIMYPRAGEPPELQEQARFSFRVPDEPDLPEMPAPWSRVVPAPDQPRVLRDVHLEWLSLDAEPGPYQAVPEADLPEADQ